MDILSHFIGHSNTTLTTLCNHLFFITLWAWCKHIKWLLITIVLSILLSVVQSKLTLYTSLSVPPPPLPPPSLPPPPSSLPPTNPSQHGVERDSQVGQV